jgi:peroxiredoxin
MAKTLSSMLPIGTKAPLFSLPDVVSKQNIALKSINSSITVIFFVCNHCPYVKHIMPGVINLARDYLKKDICFLAISSNDVINYPDDSPEKMEELARKDHYPFPYLFDETQEVAKAYQATCTPDFFVFDKKKHLVYRGQFDDSRPGNSIEVDGKSLRQALDCLRHNIPVPAEQKPSLGCNIKWR